MCEIHKKFSLNSYKHNTGFRKILVISTKDHVKTLEFLISMVSMTISSQCACKETEDFH